MRMLTRAEELILLAVLRLGGKAYCVPIFDEIQRQTQQSWTLGAIYPPLYRLEKQGYLTSSMGNPTPERGGKSKRFYQVTEAGMEALQEVKRLHDVSWNGLAVE